MRTQRECRVGVSSAAVKYTSGDRRSFDRGSAGTMSPMSTSRASFSRSCNLRFVRVPRFSARDSSRISWAIVATAQQVTVRCAVLDARALACQTRRSPSGHVASAGLSTRDAPERPVHAPTVGCAATPIPPRCPMYPARRRRSLLGRRGGERSGDDLRLRKARVLVVAPPRSGSFDACQQRLRSEIRARSA